MPLSVEERFQRLSQHRRDHIARVMMAMEGLARAHGMDVEAARLAAFGHDLAREMSRPDLKDEATRLGLRIGAEEEHEPILLHGPIAARWLRQAHRGNPSVWQAIEFHTTGAPGLDDLGKALFIADGVEPGRQYEAREVLWHLALSDLNHGYCAVLDHTRAYLVHRGLTPHPRMLAALKDC